ncbi:MAG: PIN domain-containing protein [Nitrospira sp.]|nr:PIN domain-containing protein [Nitrospira sp.]MDE0405542.1 PIN domain-containing protein [Nitrospira sp.]MDE0487068.1 PIN domain-containing protein [Nitrospira sp.]
MTPAGFFIDANLLLLLIVGSVGRDLIAKHRRLQEKFAVEDFDRLINLLHPEQVFVTPNTLTETSNLLGQHREPERSRFFDKLKFIIQESKEVVVASSVASRNNAFERLGLTDAALLEVATPETPLVTVDLDLYLAALAKGQDAAVNFTHHQDL